MSTTSPDARRAWMREHGIPSRLGDDATYARDHHYDPDAVTDDMLIAQAWRGESGGRFDRDILDVPASMAEQRMVTRRVVGNTFCECGREAIMPPVDPYGQFRCTPCWEDAKRSEWEQQVEVDLAARTAARFLDEVTPLFNDEVLGGNPLRDRTARPTPRVAQR